MPSLYHHEKLTDEYTQCSDEQLVNYSQELLGMELATEIPRQLGVIARLLDYIEFEVRSRLKDGAVQH